MSRLITSAAFVALALVLLGASVHAQLGGYKFHIGDAGDNVLEGDGNRDVMVGGDGHDTLRGFGNDDRLAGGNGNDECDGGDGNDRVLGGDGNDNLAGGTGRDRIVGGPGIDVLIDGTWNISNPPSDCEVDDLDARDGVSGNDHVYAGPNDRIRADDGDFVTIKAMYTSHIIFVGTFAEWKARQEELSAYDEVLQEGLLFGYSIAWTDMVLEEAAACGISAIVIRDGLDAMFEDGQGFEEAMALLIATINALKADPDGR